MLNNNNTAHSKTGIIVSIALIVVTLAVYSQVQQFDFVNLDDNYYIKGNSYIQSGITLDSVRWAFSTTYAEFWHPLTWLSLMFDYQLYGLNAGGYHMTNLILHILSALLLFWLFDRMTGEAWKSAFVAALFALHPLHVESVAWISERKDVLSAFFWMLTLCLYVDYTKKPSVIRYLTVLFSFAAALMSKPMVVTLPVIMILLDYWPLKRFEQLQRDGNKNIGGTVMWQLKEKATFFILSALFSVVTLYAQYNPSVNRTSFPLSSRIANAPVSFVTYLEKTFMPYDMAVLYPFSNPFPLGQVLGAALLILIITVAVIVLMKSQPHLFTGWLWYSITLLPVIGIQAGKNLMADRYAYLPSIGIAVALAWGMPYFFKREEWRKKILFPAGICFLAVMAVVARQQCGYWKNSVALWGHTLNITANNYLAHNYLGLALFAKGESMEAIDHYNRAIEIMPDFVEPYRNRGYAYAYLGRYRQALEDYNRAIRLNPENMDAYYIRGNIHAKLNRYQNAVEDYNKVIQMQNGNASAYYNRGLTYLLQRNEKSGCRDAQTACDLGNCKLLILAKSKGYCR
jgi:protein O-mannosyl-transferase